MLQRRLPYKYNIGFARAPSGLTFTFSIMQGSWFHDSMHVESTVLTSASKAWSTSLHFHMFKHEAFAWNFIKLFLLMYSNSMQSCSFYFALHFFPALQHALQHAVICWCQAQARGVARTISLVIYKSYYNVLTLDICPGIMNIHILFLHQKKKNTWELLRSFTVYMDHVLSLFLFFFFFQFSLSFFFHYPPSFYFNFIFSFFITIV